MTKAISVQVPPKRQLNQVGQGNARNAVMFALASAFNVMHSLDSYCLDKFQKPRIVRTDVIDPMAVVRHDETASHAKEHLVTQVSTFGAELGEMAV